MNLNDSPTVGQLKQLFRMCNDSDGHHVLWVARNGEVHISLVPDELTPVGFEESKSNMQMRYETFCIGNDYVGESAAQDERLMSSIFASLVKEWPDAKGSADVDYIDVY